MAEEIAIRKQAPNARQLQILRLSKWRSVPAKCHLIYFNLFESFSFIRTTLSAVSTSRILKLLNKQIKFGCCGRAYLLFKIRHLVYSQCILIYERTSGKKLCGNYSDSITFVPLFYVLDIHGNLATAAQHSIN